MSTPEDQVDTTASPQGALSALHAPETSPEGREWGTNYLKSHPEGVDTRGEAALLQDFAANAEEARAALRQARERLSQQRLDPRILAYNFAAAMLSPSRGGVPDQWSKAAGAMGDYAKQQQDFQQSQGQQDLALAQQLSGVDRQSLQARLALQELKERTQGTMLDAAMKATAQPQKLIGAESPIGKLVEDKLGVGSLRTPEGQKLFDAYQAQARMGKIPGGVGDIPPELQQAIDERRLDPSRLNSRTVGIYARLAQNNPQLNFNQMIADAALQKNAAFQQRAITMESMPEVMAHMVDLGKKVGFDDVKFAGRVEKFMRGELNDPALQEYMTVRNDALMSIAGVMRGVGMSDKAHEAEIEAGAPTMSPKALDAWFRGQMSTLEPRLKRTQRVAHLGDPAYSGATATGSTPPAKVTLDEYLKKQGY